MLSSVSIHYGMTDIYPRRLFELFDHSYAWQQRLNSLLMKEENTESGSLSALLRPLRGTYKTAKTGLRDSAPWLPLSAWVNSRNLGLHIF